MNITELIAFTDTLKKTKPDKVLIRARARAHNLMNIAELIAIIDILKLKYEHYLKNIAELIAFTTLKLNIRAGAQKLMNIPIVFSDSDTLN